MKNRVAFPFFAASCLALASGAARSYGTSPGSSGMAEMELPASAFSAATGPAGAGLVEDASAVVENPGHLDLAGKTGLSATYSVWPIGLSDSHVAVSGSWRDLGSFGASLRMFSGDFTRTVEDTAGAYVGENGKYGYQTVAGSFAWAPDPELIDEVTPGAGLRLGAGTSVVRREIAGTGIWGVGMNACVEGGLGREFHVFALGRNLGGLRGGVALPMSGALGITNRGNALSWDGGRAKAAFEVLWSQEGGTAGAAAVEYSLAWMDMEFALRAGYVMPTARQAGGLPSGGLAFKLGAISLDAGFVPLGDLGVAQVMSLTYSDRSRSEPAPVEPEVGENPF